MTASPAVLERKKKHKEQAEMFQYFFNSVRDKWNRDHVWGWGENYKPPQPVNLVADSINFINNTETTIDNVFEKLADLRSVQLEMISQWKAMRQKLEQQKVFHAQNHKGKAKAAINEAFGSAYYLFDRFNVSSGKEYKDRYRAIEDKIQELYNAIDDIGASELEYWTKKKGSKREALWARAYNKNKRYTDDFLRYKTGELWKTLSDSERESAYQYTAGSGKFNRLLSGFDGDWDMSNFKGEGNVNFNNESPDSAKYIRNLTRIIERSSYDYDIILRRGTMCQELENRLNIPIGSLRDMDDKELAKFEGREFTNRAFTSTAAEKYSGFEGEIELKILAPKGTKMIYTKPFSEYGEGDKKNWNGESKQSNFSTEFEVILQRDTSFKIKQFYKGESGKLYMQLEIVGQRDFNYQ